MSRTVEKESSGLYRIFHFIGSLFAIILSWTANHSIVWAILHCLFSWYYVVYYYFINGNVDPLRNFLHSFF